MQSERLHILLVDDEIHILDFLERALRSKYRLTRCEGPEQALAVLAEHDFDILISDQKMPAMTGLELLARATEIKPDMVRMVISGYTEQEQMDLALERGELHNYILKPVNAKLVLEAITVARENRKQGERKVSADLGG